MFSKTIKAHTEFWGMKLHNNPLSHQNTPGDYIMTYEESNHSIFNLHLYLVECKQVTCKEGKGRLAHKRLKQMHDMLSFENKFFMHKAYFCVTFYDEGWRNSDTYLIPVRVMYGAITSESKVSFNRQDMKSLFSEYEIQMKNGVLDLWKMTVLK